MINALIPQNWKKLLIQGKLNSGKSEFTLWVLNEIIKQNMIQIDHLIDNKDDVLFLTEKVDQVSLINHGLLDKMYVVENISSKDAFQVLKSYHQNYNIQLLVIDYINLLNYQSHKMRDILAYLQLHSIKAIFIENTFKLLKPDAVVVDYVDYVIETSRGNSGSGIEVLIKEKGGKRNISTFSLEPKSKKNQ